jgi:hypothetical protein
MPEILQTIIDYVVYYKVEAIASVILIALAFLRKHYDNNVMIAAFIRFTQNQIAEVLERTEDEEAGKPQKRGALKKAATRRKIRGDIAKKARRANRGKGKGSKKGGK